MEMRQRPDNGLRAVRVFEGVQKRGDGMSEAIAFIAGLFAMAAVWFINDNSPNTSPYARGYVEGYKDAMKKHKKSEVTE